MLLNIKNIDVAYDDYQVIWNVSLNVKEGEMVALLGPNGSGKSTILNSISGLIKIKTGEINFNNIPIHKFETYQRVGAGISHVLERRRVFPYLTVLQNLLLGAYHEKAKAEREKSLQDVYNFFPKLKDRSNQVANTMSGGEQQMLAIGRGLMGIPKLLMVDEPFLGLAPLVIEDLKLIFKKIAERGIAILFVEQNVRLALSMANRGYILESGRLVIDGASKDLVDSKEVKRVFLGS
ncbi:MAG: ABC transporter ATP-binding protein [Proteobacteria bacterium]|jgi:branched-chain amino acid transport system ATP-binding protein|nr:ABC transporter ATP-binding protein [Candidatus Fonsibacter sp. PEL5]NKA16686.1 ABC transporter ATP-binding protein [Candidatus Fonsibacter sp. PEL55]